METAPLRPHTGGLASLAAVCPPSLTPVTRRLSRGLLLLYPVGAILFVVGVWGGLPEAPQGWWDTTGFVVNLVSGLTAACIGIPTAFFVLQKLLDDRAKRIAREEAILLSLRNLLAIEADFLSIWESAGEKPRISAYLCSSLQNYRERAARQAKPQEGTPGRSRATVASNLSSRVQTKCFYPTRTRSLHKSLETTLLSDSTTNDESSRIGPSLTALRPLRTLP